MDSFLTASMTYCKSHAFLAAGTTTTFSTTGATLYDIKGKSFTTAAALNAVAPTIDVNNGGAFRVVGLNRGSVFVFCYDGQAIAANAIKVAQGTIEVLDGAADGTNANFVGALPQFPVVPDNLCPFGYYVVKVGASGSAFTFGVSNLSSVANVGKSFVSIGTLPDRPQAA